MREALCLNAQYKKSSTAASCRSPAMPSTPTPTPQCRDPTTGRRNATRSRSERCRGSSNALDAGRTRPRDPGAPADLPDRVRRPEQAELPRRAAGRAGRIRRNLRKDRVGRPAAWWPSPSTCSQMNHAGGGLTGYADRLRDGLETERRVQAALLRLGRCRSSSPAPGLATRCGGSCVPPPVSRSCGCYVEPSGSRHFRTLAVVTTNASGYWTLHSSTRGSSWRVQLAQPGRRGVHGPADRRELIPEGLRRRS